MPKPKTKRQGKRPMPRPKPRKPLPPRTSQRRSNGGFTSKIGEGIGSALGGYMLPGLGGPLGGALGSGLGGLIGKVTGWGDYKVKYNSITKASPVVEFGINCIRVRHKEYLGDISSTTNFTTTSYALNPGLSTVFPWLANVAANYQEYVWNGLLVSFVSTSADALNSTNTALGKIGLSTNYDPAAAPFSSFTSILQTEFANYGKPSEHLMHAIECAPKLRPTNVSYVRTGAVPTGADIHMYDLGFTQLSTQGSQAVANVGGLWVTYDVTLCKPVIALPTSTADNFTQTSVVAAQNPIFTGLNLSGRPIGGQFVGNVYTFPAGLNNGTYRVTVVNTAPSGTPSYTQNIGTLVNCAVTNAYNMGSSLRITTSTASTADLICLGDIRISASVATFTITATQSTGNLTMLFDVRYLGP